MSPDQLFFKYAVYYPVVFLRREWLPMRLASLNRTQHCSPEQLRDYQKARLIRLLQRARNEVPYYRECLADLDLRDGDDFWERFAQVPFVTKQTTREQHEALVHPELKQSASPKTTGGSTGRAVTVYKSHHAMGWELAANWRGFSWAGIDIGDKQARFWGIPQTGGARRRARLIDWVSHRIRLSAFSFGDDEMQAYYRRIEAFRPRYFYGYVSMLERYAAFLERKGMRHSFPIEAVIPTAEELTPSHRRLFERAFDTRVYNEYGCGELGTIAHEAEDGRMYVNAENMLVEILDGDRRCAAGELGEIVVTELNNLAMPLIRYRLGDFAAFAEHRPDGRGLPVLERIAGRAYDMVYNREGRMFHGEFFMYIMEDAKRQDLGVSAFQVVQDSFEQFTVRVVPEPSYSEATERFIAERIRQGYGAYAEIRFEQVEAIQRERSGKIRLIRGIGEPPPSKSSRAG